MACDSVPFFGGSESPYEQRILGFMWKPIQRYVGLNHRVVRGQSKTGALEY